MINGGLFIETFSSDLRNNRGTSTSSPQFLQIANDVFPLIISILDLILMAPVSPSDFIMISLHVHVICVEEVISRSFLI